MVQENDLAPDFQLTADDGSTVNLSDFRGKRVILFFYPRADTPGCTTEACEFGEQMPRIEDRDAVVFGISPDSVEDVRRFRDKFDLPYNLLADPEHSVAEMYGVWKEKSMYGKKYMGVERSTFLIDEQGRIAKAFLKVSPKGHAAKVVAEL